MRVEGDSHDLVLMSSEGIQQLSSVGVPQFSRSVEAARDDFIAA